uniref:Uncharacterized protein n=1 Tax=viral metagenome TaxID=1070528 RepID=A0A6C0HVT3_9ZZZZ
MANIIFMSDIIYIINNIKEIYGIVLITALLPIIYLTEINNKKEEDDYNLSLDTIDKNIKLTNTTIYYPEMSLTDCIIDGYKIRQEDIINRNFYIKSIDNTNNTKSSSFIITPSLSKLNEPIILKRMVVGERGDVHINNSVINNIEVISIDNYIYLASFNKIYTTISEYNNISYTIEVYSIPLNTQFLKVEGLKKFENELKIPIYDYEFGPKENAINSIKNRKIKIDIYRKWVIRVILIIILLIGIFKLY